MNNLKEIPLPVCGIILAVFSLGTIIQEYNPLFKWIFFTIGIIFLIAYALQTVNSFDKFKEDLENPILVGSLGTLPMAIMVLSTYFSMTNIRLVIWAMGIILYLIVMCIYTMKFTVKRDINTFFTSIFIPYIGIGIAATTGLDFIPIQYVKDICFIFSFISFIILFLIVSYRYIVIGNIPEVAKPLVCIYAAPASLVLTSYLETSFFKSPELVIVLIVMSIILFTFSFIKFIGFRNLPFYPSFAAFTFPFVISTKATKEVIQYISSINLNITGLDVIYHLELLIATIIVVYVIIRYSIHILNMN